MALKEFLQHVNFGHLSKNLVHLPKCYLDQVFPLSFVLYLEHRLAFYNESYDISVSVYICLFLITGWNC